VWLSPWNVMAVWAHYLPASLAPSTESSGMEIGEEVVHTAQACWVTVGLSLHLPGLISPCELRAIKGQ
jgi:hypothetical protein